MYYAVYGGTTAPTTFDPTKGAIYPYVKSAAVYLCPDDLYNANTGDTYAINSCLDKSGFGSTGGLAPGKSSTIFQYPTTTLMLAEEDYSSTSQTGDHSRGSTDDAYIYEGTNWVSTRHSGGSVMAFLDAHVKWVSNPNATLATLQFGDTASTSCPGG